MSKRVRDVKARVKELVSGLFINSFKNDIFSTLNIESSSIFERLGLGYIRVSVRDDAVQLKAIEEFVRESGGGKFRNLRRLDSAINSGDPYRMIRAAEKMRQLIDETIILVKVSQERIN